MQVIVIWGVLGVLPAFFVVTTMATKESRRNVWFWFAIFKEVCGGPISVFNASVNRGEWFDYWNKTIIKTSK